MFGVRLMFLLAVMGGIIAFIADKLGSKIGKKKLSVFGLRPHDTSVLLTVLSGVLIALFSVGTQLALRVSNEPHPRGHAHRRAHSASDGALGLSGRNC